MKLTLSMILMAGALGLAAVPAHAAIIYRTVVLSGEHAPGTPAGYTFGVWDYPVLDSSGRVAFSATLRFGSIGSTMGGGIWSEGPGALTLVARHGERPPGTATGVVFDSLYEFFSPVLIRSGRTTFFARLGTALGGSVNNENNSGIWSEGVGALALVAREGSQAPGTPVGAMFDEFEPSIFGYNNLVSNDLGQTAFLGRLKTTGGGVTNSNNSGIWSGGAGSLALVAREGSQAPGTPTGALFEDFPNDANPVFSNPVLNNVGQTAFVAALRFGTGGVNGANASGIWSEGSGTLALVAREGSQAPGAPSGASFRSFTGSVALNDAGQTAFLAALRDNAGGVTDDNNWGIWSEGSGTLALVAREGSQAPGAPQGANFNSLGSPLLSGSGRTAFYGSLKTTGGGVTADNDTGIWSEGSGALALVAREGSQAPGTPVGTNFSAFGGMALNGSGRVAFYGHLQTTGGGVTAANDNGIWAEDSRGVLRLVAREGNAIEIAPGDFRTLSLIRFAGTSGGQDGRGVTFNDDFTLAFYAYFTDGSGGVFTATLAIPEPSSLSLLALSVVGLLSRRRSVHSSSRWIV